jgi:hypothetical protein
MTKGWNVYKGAEYEVELTKEAEVIVKQLLRDEEVTVHFGGPKSGRSTILTTAARYDADRSRGIPLPWEV